MLLNFLISSKYYCFFITEDYEYVSGLGDLDYYNGRYCVTPEYPSGTYAYFVSVNSSYVPQYPYIIGPYFYGKLKLKISFIVEIFETFSFYQ